MINRNISTKISKLETKDRKGVSSVEEHELFKQARERSPYDQRAAAAIANITPSCQCKYENGSLCIPNDVLTRLYDTPMGRTPQFIRLLKLRCARCSVGQILNRHNKNVYKQAS